MGPFHKKKLYAWNSLKCKTAASKPCFYGRWIFWWSFESDHFNVFIRIIKLILLPRCIMDNQAMFTAQQMQYKQMYAGIDPTGR